MTWLIIFYKAYETLTGYLKPWPIFRLNDCFGDNNGLMVLVLLIHA